MIHESRRHGEVAGPKSSCNDTGLVLGDQPTQVGCPADEIVGYDRAAHPGGIRREVPRGAVLHAHPFFQVANVELAERSLSVEGVDVGGGAGQIGQESEVAPVGP